MSASAPSGLVTLMFTDIEGSTKLLERLRETYATVLEEHRDMLRAAFERHSGYEVDTQGDSFFVAFGSASEAIACAVDIQRAIAAHDWPGGAELRVRIGIHTGQPSLAATGYVGVDVHRGARIGAAAHGGQILLSAATRDELGAADDGYTFDDLGVHRFKGLAEPTPVFGLQADGLLTDFPPIRASAPEDEPPTAGEPPYKGLLRFDAEDAELYFGREELVAQVAAAVRERPFMAVIGASGSGKSSLVRAGVIPAVSGSAVFDRVVVFTPTADPVEALGAVLDGPGLVVIDQFEELFTLCRDEDLRTEFVARLMAAAGDRLHVLITLRADFYAEVSQFPELREQIADNQFYIGPMAPADLRRAIEEPARRGSWEIAPGLVDLLLRDVGSEPGALPLLSHALLETWHRRRGSRMTLKGYFESGEVSGAIARTADRLYAELSATDQPFVRNILLRLTELGEGAQDTRRRAALDELVPAGGAAQSTNDVLRRLIDARLVTVDEGAAEVAHEALIREWPLLREWLQDDREGLRVQRQVTEAAAEWHAMAREPSLLFRGARLATAREWNAAHAGSLTDGEAAFLAASIDAEESDQREREDQQRRELEAAQRAAEAERLRAEEQSAAARRLRRRAYILVGAVILAAGLGVAAFAFASQANEQATIARDQTTVAQEQQAEAERQRTEAETQRSLAEERQREAEEERNNATSRQLAVQAAATRSDLDLSLLLGVEGVGRSDTLEARQSLLSGLLSEPRLSALARINSAGEQAWFTDSGAGIATLSTNGDVHSWDILDGGHLRERPMFTTSAYTNAELSTDGSPLALLVDDTARVWDIESGEELATFDVCADGGYAVNVALSQDGAVLAASCAPTNGETVRAPDGVTLIDLAGGEPAVLPAGNPSVLELSPDGTLLVTLGQVASEATAGPVAALPFFDTAPPLGDAVAVWDVATGELASDLSVGPGIQSVSFSPDSETLGIAFSGDENGANRRVELWDVAGTQPRLSFDLDSQPNTPLVFAPNGEMLAVTTDLVASLHSTQQTDDSVLPLPVVCSRAYEAAFSPDGAVLAAKCFEEGGEPTVVLYDVGTIEPSKLAAHSARLFDLDFAPNGDLVSIAQSETGAQSTIALWRRDATDRITSSVATLEASEFPVVWLTADGTTALEYDASGAVVLWNTADGRLVAGLDCPPTSEGFSGGQIVEMSGSIIACASDERRRLEIHDRSDGQLLRILSRGPAEAGVITDVELSPEGDFIIASYSTSSFDQPDTPVSTLVWRTSDGTRVVDLGEDTRALTFSPAGTLLAAAIGNEIAIYDTTTWSRVASLAGHDVQVGALAFDASGQTLASGDANGIVILWDTAQFEPSGAPLRGHEGAIRKITFGPDGELATTDDSWTYLWDAERRLPLGPLPDPGTLGFDAHGALLSVRALEIVRWDLETDDLREAACTFANRNLTDEEWELYLPDEEYRATCP